MALTRDQKNAIFWCDYCAGLATAGLGAISFAIGAAASTAYYMDKKATEGWNIDFPVPNPIPSTSDDQGELHNLTCEQFIANGFTLVTLSNIVQSASEVRPDLTSELQSITETYFDEKVSAAQTQSMKTVQEELDYTMSYIPLNNTDQIPFIATLNVLQSADEIQCVNSINNLILQVTNFTLTETEKTALINSLQILKHSSILWGN